MLLILFVSNTFADSSQITYATTLNSYFRYLFTELITRNFMDPLTVVVSSIEIFSMYLADGYVCALCVYVLRIQ